MAGTLDFPPPLAAHASGINPASLDDLGSTAVADPVTGLAGGPASSSSNGFDSSVAVAPTPDDIPLGDSSDTIAGIPTVSTEGGDPTNFNSATSASFSSKKNLPPGADKSLSGTVNTPNGTGNDIDDRIGLNNEGTVDGGSVAGSGNATATPSTDSTVYPTVEDAPTGDSRPSGTEVDPSTSSKKLYVEVAGTAFTTPATATGSLMMPLEPNMGSNIASTDTSPSPKNLYNIFSKMPSKSPTLTPLGKTSPAIKAPATVATTLARPTIDALNSSATVNPSVIDGTPSVSSVVAAVGAESITHGAETPGNFTFGTTCAAPTQPSTDATLTALGKTRAAPTQPPTDEATGTPSVIDLNSSAGIATAAKLIATHPGFTPKTSSNLQTHSVPVFGSLSTSY